MIETRLDLRALALALLDLAERDPEVRARLRAIVGPSDVLVSATETGVPVRTWRAACRSGAIVGARKVGREYLAPRSSVEQWLESLPGPEPAPPKSGPRETSNRVDEEGDEFDRALARRKRSA